MPTPSPASGSPALAVPPETQQKFPEIIELIKTSESMNDEERQYWVNILPIMTPDQVANLKNILTNERQQLSAIDKKYGKEVAAVQQEEALRRADELRRSRRNARAAQEHKNQEAEDRETDALLKTIEGGGPGGSA